MSLKPPERNAVVPDLIHLYQCNIYYNASKAVNVSVIAVVHNPSNVWSVVAWLSFSGENIPIVQSSAP